MGRGVLIIGYCLRAIGLCVPYCLFSGIFVGGQSLDGGGQSRDGGSPESPTRENPRLYSSQNIRAFYVIYFCSWNSRHILYFEL